MYKNPFHTLELRYIWNTKIHVYQMVYYGIQMNRIILGTCNKNKIEVALGHPIWF